MGVRQLTREEIFAARDIQTEEVGVPEWGEGAVVRVRAFSVATRDAFFAPINAVSKDDEPARIAAGALLTHSRLLVFSVVDAADKLLFTEADIPSLESKSPAAIKRIATVAQRLNGIGGDEEGAIAKNSGASPS